MIDYAFVYKHFNKKWSTKYSVRERKIEKGYSAVMQSPRMMKQYHREFNGGMPSQHAKNRNQKAVWRLVFETNTMYFPELMLIWKLSRTRLVCLSLSELRPLNQSAACFDDISD